MLLGSAGGSMTALAPVELLGQKKRRMQCQQCSKPKNRFRSLRVATGTGTSAAQPLESILAAEVVQAEKPALIALKGQNRTSSSGGGFCARSLSSAAAAFSSSNTPAVDNHGCGLDLHRSCCFDNLEDLAFPYLPSFLLPVPRPPYLFSLVPRGLWDLPLPNAAPSGSLPISSPLPAPHPLAPSLLVRVADPRHPSFTVRRRGGRLLWVWAST